MQGQKDPCAGIVLGSVLHAHDHGMCSFPSGTGSSCSLCDIAQHPKSRFCPSTQKELYTNNKIIQDGANPLFQCCFSSLCWLGLTDFGSNNLSFFQLIIPIPSSLQDVSPKVILQQLPGSFPLSNSAGKEIFRNQSAYFLSCVQRFLRAEAKQVA